jgi:hypothetical protein
LQVLTACHKGVPPTDLSQYLSFGNQHSVELGVYPVEDVPTALDRINEAFANAGRSENELLERLLYFNVEVAFYHSWDRVLSAQNSLMVPPLDNEMVGVAHEFLVPNDRVRC